MAYALKVLPKPPLDPKTRQQIIEILAEEKVSRWNEQAMAAGLEDLFKDIALGGHRGYHETSDEELLKLGTKIFGYKEFQEKIYAV